MKRLLYVIIMLIVISVIHAALVWGVNLGKWSEFFGENDQLIRGDYDADILIIGASRAYFHFGKKKMSSILRNQKIYNLGLDGTPLDYQLPYLEMYLRTHKAPRLIIKEVNIGSLTDTQEPALKTGAHKFLAYYDMNIRTFPNKDLNFYLYRYIPLIMFNLNSNELLIKSLAGYKYAIQKKMGQLKPIKEDRFFKAHQTVDKTIDFESFKTPRRFNISPRQIENLQHIISLAKQSKSDIILVMSPELAEGYRYQLNRHEIISFYKHFAKKERIEFWNYSDYYLNKSRKYFYNSQHLNYKGAMRFSYDFTVRLKKYLLQKKSVQ